MWKILPVFLFLGCLLRANAVSHLGGIDATSQEKAEQQRLEDDAKASLDRSRREETQLSWFGTSRPHWQRRVQEAESPGHHRCETPLLVQPSGPGDSVVLTSENTSSVDPEVSRRFPCRDYSLATPILGVEM